MSQNFKDRLDGMWDDGSMNDKVQDTSHYKTFESISQVRNIDFVWSNGDREFFNYAYLVSCRYSADESTLTLKFTTGTVILKGMRLILLHLDLRVNLPREIIAIESRYNSTVDDTDFIVNSIEVID